MFLNGILIENHKFDSTGGQNGYQLFIANFDLIFPNRPDKRDVKSFPFIPKEKRINCMLDVRAQCLLDVQAIASRHHHRYCCTVVCAISFGWLEWLALTNHRRLSRNQPTDAIWLQNYQKMKLERQTRYIGTSNTPSTLLANEIVRQYIGQQQKQQKNRLKILGMVGVERGDLN